LSSGDKFNKEPAESSPRMAKRKSRKAIETQIKEIEAVVREAPNCAACGKPIDADATTCPHCGTPVGEAAELTEKADQSLLELEKHLAETTQESPPGPSEPGQSPSTEGLESAAAVVAAVEVTALVSTPAAQMGEVVPQPAPEITPEVEPEAGETENLEGYIAEIEAEVRPEVEAPGAPKQTAVARKPAVRAVPRTAPRTRSSRWVAPVAAGFVLYVLALFLLELLGKLLVVSFMVIGTVLVVAGIRARPVSSAGSRGGPSATAEDYVCPLCGTEIPAKATRCPTCGAVFED